MHKFILRVTCGYSCCSRGIILPVFISYFGWRITGKVTLLCNVVLFSFHHWDRTRYYSHSATREKLVSVYYRLFNITWISSILRWRLKVRSDDAVRHGFILQPTHTRGWLLLCTPCRDTTSLNANNHPMCTLRLDYLARLQRTKKDGIIYLTRKTNNKQTTNTKLNLVTLHVIIINITTTSKISN